MFRITEKQFMTHDSNRIVIDECKNELIFKQESLTVHHIMVLL